MTEHWLSGIKEAPRASPPVPGPCSIIMPQVGHPNSRRSDFSDPGRPRADAARRANLPGQTVCLWGQGLETGAQLPERTTASFLVRGPPPPPPPGGRADLGRQAAPVSCHGTFSLFRNRRRAGRGATPPRGDWRAAGQRCGSQYHFDACAEPSDPPLATAIRYLAHDIAAREKLGRAA